MNDRVLLDTSYLVALLDGKDVHHKIAASIHATLSNEGALYIYLDCVLNETATVLARRALERKMDPGPVLGKLRQQIPPELIDWTGAEWPRLWNEILDCMEEHHGRLSFIDCLLAVVAREASIDRIISFDKNLDRVRYWTRLSDHNGGKGLGTETQRR
jgi:predicted nucleic acid-binding protein